VGAGGKMTCPKRVQKIMGKKRAEGKMAGGGGADATAFYKLRKKGPTRAEWGQNGRRKQTGKV